MVDRIDAFNIKIETCLKKFKRLTCDWLVMKELMDLKSAELAELGQRILDDSNQQMHVISTIVELQYMHNAMDLQEEHDRHQLHLFGMNDTNLTL